ncbi:MAG TPA: ERAP1-like C-terminal domain-containing protein, partial [Polyangiaceae bacterium]|nr:ERAP1-like C-terminal domain-containing protein [Polyangiaceae bacterium]
MDQSGVPVLHLDLQCRGQKTALSVTQREWIPVGRAAGGPKLWAVPVCIRAKTPRGVERVCVLQTQATQRHDLELSGCPSLWTPNDAETGYYRSALTPKMRKVLARAAPTFLTARERAGLVSSSFAMVEAGQTPLAEHVKLLRGLTSERTRGVWLEVLRQLRVIEFWVPQGARASFAEFVRALLGPTARRLSAAPKAGEADDARLLRAEIWDALADLGADAAATKQLEGLAQAWLNGGQVHPDLARVALARPAAEGGPGLLGSLLERLSKAELPEQRMILLAGLAGAEDPAQVRTVLDASLTEAFRVQDLRKMLLAFLARASTARVTAQWMTDHGAPLNAKLPNFARGRVIERLGSVCDVALVAAAGRAIAGNSGEPKMQLSRAEEQAKLCAAARR